jgi:transcriptional/translational regulatory protein YebC/TACO1
VSCGPSHVFDLKAALEAAGVEVSSAVSTMMSSMTVAVTDPADARAVLRIMDELDENDDVQDVFSNFDIPEILMAEVAP